MRVRQAILATDNYSPSAYGATIPRWPWHEQIEPRTKNWSATRHPRLQRSIRRRPAPPSGDWAAPAQAQPPAPCRWAAPKLTMGARIDDEESLKQQL